MLNCHNATRLMSEAQERKLAVSEVMSLKFHRMMCQGCNNFGKQMVGLRTPATVIHLAIIGSRNGLKNYRIVIG